MLCGTSSLLSFDSMKISGMPVCLCLQKNYVCNSGRSFALRSENGNINDTAVLLAFLIFAESVDVNVTPDKRQIFVEGERHLLAVIKVKKN